MRTRGRVDQNQRDLVSLLRQYGASVYSLADVGNGVPDLLVGYQGRNYLVEVKDGAKSPSRRRLTSAQLDFRETWRGEAPRIVETREDVARLLHGR